LDLFGMVVGFERLPWVFQVEGRPHRVGLQPPGQTKNREEAGNRLFAAGAVLSWIAGVAGDGTLAGLAASGRKSRHGEFYLSGTVFASY
jgi:hypothetical protein